jgi:uncharacterized OB-fold protein
MTISDEKWFKDFQKAVNKWIKANNWKGGKCVVCGKTLLPIIDYNDYCATCLKKKIYEVDFE